MFPLVLILTALFLPLLVVLTFCSCCRLFGARKVLVSELPAAMLQHWRERPGTASKLPDFLQGVFWMSDNVAPEVLVCFMGEDFDPVSRRLTVLLGRQFNWSYNSNALGVLEFLAVSLLGLGSSIVLQFNEDYTSAELRIVILGLVDGTKLSKQEYSMKRQVQDPENWDRVTKLDGQISEGLSYTLRRVLDQEGNKLPAFGDMVKQAETGAPVKGVTVKSKIQLVQTMGAPSCGFCCRRNRKSEADKAEPAPARVQEVLDV